MTPLIQTYVEGIGVDGIFVAFRGGFEALRLLGKEFSLRTRTEASFFRKLLKEKNTLKIFMLQLGKGLRSAIGAGRLGTYRKNALQICPRSSASDVGKLDI